MRVAVLIGALVLGGAACGGSETGGDKPTGLLVVKQVQTGGPYYIEGSKSYVRAEPGGHDVELSSSRTPTASLKLAPGDYTLQSWQRPCDGNCGALDPPTDRCAGPVTVTSGSETHVTINLRAGEACEIVAS